MLEVFFEIIFDILFSYPGAAIRWLFHGGKIPYKTLIKEDAEYNALAFFLLLAICFIIITLFT